MPRESNTSPRRLRAFQRQLRALEYRRAGFTYEQIAVALRYSGRQSAHYAVERALKFATNEVTEDLILLELLRLDSLFCRVYLNALSGHLPSISACLSIMKTKDRLLRL